MPQEPIKKRICRAKAKATRLLQSTGYRVIKSDNETFCVIATRRREVRFIRVVVDDISAKDREAVRKVDLPGDCAREIYCLKGCAFIIEEIEPRNRSSANPPTA